MEEKAKLLNCETYKQGDKYYLDLEYEIEKTDGIYIRKIPKVDLCIPKNFLSIDKVSIFGDDICVFNEFKIVLSNGSRLPLVEVNGELCHDTLIKKKTKKMTIAEIEKELGYSVEIVSKK